MILLVPETNPLVYSLGMAVPKIITTVSRRPITVTEVGTDQESQETAQNEIAGPTPSTPDTVPTATTIAMTTATTSEAAIIQAAAESAPIVLPTAEVTQANLLSTTVAHSTSKLFQPGPKPTGRYVALIYLILRTILIMALEQKSIRTNLERSQPKRDNCGVHKSVAELAQGREKGTCSVYIVGDMI